MSKIAANKTKIKQRIEALEKESKMIQADLGGELDVSKGKLMGLAKIILGVGGGLIFSSIVLKSLIGKRSKKGIQGKLGSKRVYQRFMTQLMSELSFQATRLVLNIAKEKLKSHSIIKENTGDNDSEITG